MELQRQRPGGHGGLHAGYCEAVVTRSTILEGWRLGPPALEMVRVLQLLVRALARRCPHCGARGVTRRWIEVRRLCPVCGLRLDRGEPDYWLGALLFNLIAAELLFAAGVLAVLLLTWPQPPWDVLQWGGIPVLVAFPILTYPITKLLWLGFDLIFRPPTAGDFAQPDP